MSYQIANFTQHVRIVFWATDLYKSADYQAKSPALVIHARESTRPAELEINIGDILFLHRRLRCYDIVYIYIV